MKKIFCISGLGSDKKVFARIQVPGYELVHIDWLMPEKNEPLAAYAQRMSACITDENPVLMGLSFGGMLSIEIAKILPVQKLLLVSSVKSHKEMPLWMRSAGKLKLNHLLPLHAASHILEPVQNYNMGVTNAEEREMVRQYRKNISQQYLEWSVNQVLNWKNDWQPPNIFHIHGDTDRIFPIRHVKATSIIKGGGHFMIFNKATEVNEKLALMLQ